MMLFMIELQFDTVCALYALINNTINNTMFLTRGSYSLLCDELT
jgi:hypothetical protein